MFGVVGVGPAARWTTAPTGGVSVDVAMPVIGMVVHPYSALRVGRPFFEPRAFTPLNLRAPRLAVAYEAPAAGRAAPFVEYDASAMRYDGALPVRSLAQSVRVGVTWKRRSAER